MLVNVNNIVKRGYKLSDCVLYNGFRYKIVAIDFVPDYEDSKSFLLNGYNSKSSSIDLEGDDLSSFVLYDSDEILDKKYSLWVSYNQISKVKDETEICHSVGKNKLYALYTGMRGDFGGKSFDKIVEASSYEDACNEARNMCIKIYKAYEGRHGMLSEKECKKYGLSYEDVINNWIVFSAMEVTSENIDIILEEFLSKSDVELLKKYKFNYGDDANENKEINV